MSEEKSFSFFFFQRRIEKYGEKPKDTKFQWKTLINAWKILNDESDEGWPRITEKIALGAEHASPTESSSDFIMPFPVPISKKLYLKFKSIAR